MASSFATSRYGPTADTAGSLGSRFIPCTNLISPRCGAQEAIQAGPLIEQLLAETVGPDWVVSSFLSIIAGKGGHPQTLHQDGGVMMTETPLLVNQMFMLDDVNHRNGGTVVVPTSHRLTGDAGNYSPVAPLPPPVSLEAPAGTVMVFDGRLLHGTGVNQTDTRRHVMVMAAQKPWMRTYSARCFS